MSDFDLKIDEACSIFQRKKNPSIKKQKKREKKEFKAPTPIECREYFKTNGYSTVAADNFHRYYSAKNWHNSVGKPVLNWKSTANAIWFTPENQMIKPQVQQAKQSITEQDKRY